MQALSFVQSVQAWLSHVLQERRRQRGYAGSDPRQAVSLKNPKGEGKGVTSSLSYFLGQDQIPFPVTGLHRKWWLYLTHAITMCADAKPLPKAEALPPPGIWPSLLHLISLCSSSHSHTAAKLTNPSLPCRSPVSFLSP